MIGGFSLGRWFGFEVDLDYSWFLVFALVVWTFSVYEFPRQLPGYSTPIYYTMGVVGGLVFFLSVLLHELAHSGMARARGIEVEGITLFIFGGVARTRMEAERPIDEFLLTAVGPLTSLGLAAAFWGVALLAGSLGWPPPLRTVCNYLALLNLVLAIFNMFPGFPLDGGRIFRSIVWAVTGDLERATRWATRGGKLLGWLLVGFGVFQILQWGAFLAGLWSVFIGWFLASAASASYRQFTVRRTLSRVPTWRVMAREPVSVDPDVTVERLVEDYFLRRADDAYPVVRDGRVLGLVGVEDVARVPAGDRAGVRAYEVMRHVEDVPTATREETLDRVLMRLSGGEEERVLVVEDGRLLGVLSVDEIGQWVARVRELETA